MSEQVQVKKIVAMDKEVHLPGLVPISSTDKENVVSFVKDFNAEVGKTLENTPFRSEVRDETLFIYRTDAHFG